MSRRHYVNNAQTTQTTGAISSSDVTVTLVATTTLPTSTPWTAVIDGGTATAEEVLVTALAGSVATITRGYDGSPAQAHASGATFQHAAVAADYDEANSHHQATTGVHGVGGHVVGDSDAQTLSNKTLVAPVVTSGATVSGGATIAGGATVSSGTTSVVDLTVSGNLTVGGLALSNASIAWLVPQTVDPIVASSSVSFGVANVAWYGRIVQSGSWNISSISVPVNVSNGLISVALFRDNGSGLPGTLVAQATPASSGGIATLSLGGTFTVSRGDWFAVVAAGSSESFSGVTDGRARPTWRAVQGTGHAPGSLVSNPSVTSTTVGIPLWGL